MWSPRTAVDWSSVSGASRPSAPPRWLRAWENLPAQAQVLIAFPTLVVALFVVHITLLRQPVGRGLLYGVFWGVLATFAVVIATRTEAAKRRGTGGPPDEQ